MAKIDWITVDDLKKYMVDGIEGARETFELGVDNPRRDTIQAAILAIQKGIWEKNFKEGIGKWETKLKAVTLDDWKKATDAAASIYADRAREVGTKHWQEYYTKAKSVIEAAVDKFLKTDKDKAALLEFWRDLQKLKELRR